MQLVSQCALSVSKLLWRPSHGGYAYTVVCKATFELEPNLSPLAHEQEPIYETNEWSENGSLVRASDLAPSKKRNEVLLVGNAYAPGGRPVTSLVTRLVVGSMDKSILVIGDRYVTADGRVGEAAAFDRMPLVWDRAVATAENPIGKQFGSLNRSTPASSEWSLAPNLYPVAFEWPRPGMPIAPMAYAPISPLWPGRHVLLQKYAAGWDPHRWHERPLPADFDFAYMNAAPADQQRPAPFAEDAIYLENLHPELPRLSTRLDALTPTATVDQGAGPAPLALRCDTLLIDTNRALAMLVWRGQLVVDHPDRPVRVIITTPNARGFSAPDSEKPEQAEAKTLIPGVTGPRQSAILPFRQAQAAAAMTQASPGMLRDRPELLADSDGTATIIPTASPVQASGLPFLANSAETRPTRNDSLPFKPATSTASSGLAAWKQLGADAATPAPPPVSEITLPPTVSGTPFTNPAVPPPMRPALGSAPEYSPPPPNISGTPFTPSAMPQPPPMRPSLGSTPEYSPPPPMRPSLGSTPEYAPAPPMRPSLGSTPEYAPAPPMRPSLGSTPGLGSGVALGSMGVLAPAPAQATSTVMAAPKVPETNKPTEEDLENRLRLVQRAIWKGDRPIEQILSAHGFTELEWRAAKRASARKSAV